MKIFSSTRIALLCLGLGAMTLPVLETAARAQAETDFTTDTDGNGGLIITGYTGTVKAVVIPGTIGGQAVTQIGTKAFQSQGTLTSMTFPSSMRTIGPFAFQSCSGLTSVTLNSGLTTLSTDAFEGCSGFTSIAIPSSVSTIGSYAFSHCSGLTSVTIPYGVTAIQQQSFEDCTNLASIFIPASVTTIAPQAFQYCTSLASVTIPSSMTHIMPYVFLECTALTNATFDGDAPTMDANVFAGVNASFKVTYYAYAQGYTPGSGTWTDSGGDSFTTNTPIASPFSTSTDSNNQITITGYSGSATALDIPGKIGGLPVVAIGSAAFSTTSDFNLGSVSIPSSVTSIGTAAFLDCSSLTSVVIPSSVTSIGNDAFELTGLTSATIPASVTSIGQAPFDQCPITAITVDPANPNYLSTAEGVLLDKNETVLIDYPGGRNGAYTVPATVTSIANQAFDDESGLTSVTLPAGLTSIGQYAFARTGITSVTLPSGVTSIGNSAFTGCGLTSVTIPASVSSIGSNAFNGNNLTSAVFNGNAPTMEGGVFANTNSGFTVDYFNNATGFTEPTWKANAGDNYSSAAADYGTTVANNQVTITSYAGPNVVFIPAAFNGMPIASFGTVFENNASLTNVTVLQGMTSIPANAFQDCSGLTSVTLPNSVTSLGDNAFVDCIELSSVNIPTNLLSIGNFTFFGCYSLTSATLPASVTSIGVGPFAACFALPAITVDPANPDFISVNGVLFNINETNLIQYPAGNTATSYTIPSSVTSLRQAAFEYSGNLTSVILPASVTSIGVDAFESCANLTSALFLGNAPTMGSGVFGSVGPGFKVYYYNGATGFTPGNGTWLDTSGDSYPSVDLMATSLTSWIAGFPGTTNTAPAATPEKDGVPNLLKYLYDIDPSRPMTATDRAALPDFGLDTTTTPGSTYLTLIYRQYAGETGITINVQTSTGLKTWTTLTSGQYTNVPTGAYSPIGDPFMQISVLASGPREFLRLNVTQP